jgi:hypothetical protein
MNVGLRVVIKRTLAPIALAVLTLTISGCAQTTVFSSAKEAVRISVRKMTIYESGATFRISDCSSPDWICLRSESGFLAQFPKRCPAAEWFPDNGPLRRVSSLPHSRGGEYRNSPEGRFRYLWDERKGLAAIEVRLDHKATAEEADWKPLFYTSGPVLFKCK